MTQYLQNPRILNATTGTSFLFILMLAMSLIDSSHDRVDARSLQRANLKDGWAGSDGVV